ncbi:MAG: alkaline phosphatase family protein, partial [Chloroflexota bacterium]|nr:alkaline phosphatase family protein [Chloroflexota bacterium]
TKGVQVEGHGHPGASLHQVSQRHAWATYPLAMPPAARDTGLTPYADRITLRAAEWPNAPQGVARTLEADVTLKLSRGQAQQPLFALLVDRGDGRGFAEARVNARRDWEGSVGAEPGAWTPPLRCPIRLYPPAHEWDARDGNGPLDANYFLRFKVMELASDGSRFKLYAPGGFPDRGWTVPDDLCATLVREVGPYVETAGVGAPFRSGWTDVETFLEECAHQVDWLSGAARYLMPRTDWDLFMAQLHVTDHAGHSMLGHTDPQAYYFDPALQAACTEGYRRSYEIADRYVGAILENVPDDATVLVVSDHGMYPVRLPVVDVNEVLARAGLYHPDAPERSPAAWFYESQIRINVRGREEGGVVEPGGEYEAVRDRVIRALEAECDQRTGERVFQLVLRAEDAQLFGWYGERVGDLCYFQKPRLGGAGPGPQGQPEPVSAGEAEAGGRRAAARMLPGNGEHHYYWQMAARTDGSAPGGRAMFVLRAPGVRRGYRRPAPVELVDAAPTLAYVSGIPVPRQAEGRIRHDLFEEELF